MRICNECHEGIDNGEATICPYCGSNDLADATECGNGACTLPRSIYEPLCRKCRHRLLIRLYTICHKMTCAEREYLDEFTEGSSWHDFPDMIKEALHDR